jgi:hypothetical protein
MTLGHVVDAGCLRRSCATPSRTSKALRATKSALDCLPDRTELIVLVCRMLHYRERLPAYKERKKLVDLVNKNQVRSIIRLDCCHDC